MSRFQFLIPVFAALAAIFPPSGAKAEPADLSRLVVVGDSISAGYQSGCLLHTQQVNGFASLIADRAGVDLPLPLIGEPGAPPCLVLVDPGPPPVIERLSGYPGMRLDPTVRAHNVSVPGARIVDVANPTPDNSFHALFGIPFAEVHGLVMQGQDDLPKSQLQAAAALDPTTLFVWMGNNDVLLSATAGTTLAVTPEVYFEIAYANMMAQLAATGAAMVVANIPDVTTIPYFTSAAEVSAITGVPAIFFGLEDGDFVTPFAFDLLGLGELPDQVVLDAAEVAEIQAATVAFNGIIAEQASLYGAALVDTNAVLRFIDDFGLTVGGKRLTTDFLGGVFTLDGVHPTNTGHAVIANEFIRALNEHFDAGIRPFSVGQIAHIMRKDPLVLPLVGHPPFAGPFSALEVLQGLDVIGNGF